MNSMSDNEIAPGTLSQLIGRFSWRRAKCLYMLSTGRTGSTALAKLLNLSNQIRAYHELSPRDAMTYRDIMISYHESPNKFERYFVRHRAGVIGAVHRQGRIFAETNNFQFYAHLVSKLLPESRFVFVHRHPAEYVRSGMRRGWYLNHSWDSFRLHPRPNTEDAERWTGWSQFEKICWFWNEVNHFFIQFKKLQSAERVATIPFVELVKPESGAYRAFFDCIGVAPPSEADAATILTARVNAQEVGDFPKYADWSESQVRTLHAIAGKTMETLGYS
jgi:hypothetical protein